jgi:hypothetical protein
VRVVAAEASELGDTHARITGHGHEALALDGWVHELPALAAGATAELTATVTLAADAPEYRALVLAVALELAPLDEPAPRRVQWREATIRVARAFVADDADVLLVVSHQTTAAEIARWEATTRGVMARLALWDVSREGHLDLARPLADGRTLGELLAGKAIVVLNRAFETPIGAVAPHRMLDPDQLLRAAAARLDVVFVGERPGLTRLMVPSPPADGGDGAAATPDRQAALVAIERGQRMTVPIYRRFPLLFWRQAHRALAGAPGPGVQPHAQPRRSAPRAPRGDPAVRARARRARRGSAARCGGSARIEAARTLDADATALVHVDGEAEHATGGERAPGGARLQPSSSSACAGRSPTPGREPLGCWPRSSTRWWSSSPASWRRRTDRGPGSDDLRAGAAQAARAGRLASGRARASRPPGGDALCGLLARLHFVAETQVELARSPAAVAVVAAAGGDCAAGASPRSRTP